MQPVTVDPAALIVAFSGLLATAWGIRQARSGQRNERQQQSAANELQAKAQQHDVYRDMVSDLERQVDRQQEELDRERKRVRDLQTEHAADLGHLRDIIATLRDVVHSEIATTLADDGINAADSRLDHNEHEEG